MNRIFSTFAIAFLGLSLLMLGGCATTTAGGAVGADRSQLMTDESEADSIGLELAARAGITLWQKMTSANQGGRPPEFLSSHPADTSRVKQIEKLLLSAMPLYVAAN